MSREFIPYEQAVELKKLGFDTPSISSEHGHVWEREILYQQAFRWFREKHGLVGIIKFGTNDFTYNVYNEDGMGLLTKESLNFNSTYEEAELECLKKLIEIVKTNEK